MACEIWVMTERPRHNHLKLASSVRWSSSFFKMRWRLLSFGYKSESRSISAESSQLRWFRHRILPGKFSGNWKETPRRAQNSLLGLRILSDWRTSWICRKGVVGMDVFIFFLDRLPLRLHSREAAEHGQTNGLLSWNLFVYPFTQLPNKKKVSFLLNGDVQTVESNYILVIVFFFNYNSEILHNG